MGATTARTTTRAHRRHSLTPADRHECSGTQQRRRLSRVRGTNSFPSSLRPPLSRSTRARRRDDRVQSNASSIALVRVDVASRSYLRARRCARRDRGGLDDGLRWRRFRFVWIAARGARGTIARGVGGWIGWMVGDASVWSTP
jgi:hypothetical protein